MAQALTFMPTPETKPLSSSASPIAITLPQLRERASDVRGRSPVRGKFARPVARPSSSGEYSFDDTRAVTLLNP